MGRFSRRERDGRTLEFCIDADGCGSLLVQEDDPARQSVWLTTRELRWMLVAVPVALLRSLWLRDGGGSDKLSAALAAVRTPEEQT